MTIAMERIDENTRVVTSDTDEIYIKRNTNGTDLWHIAVPSGALHKTLEGQYTTPTAAYDRVKNYLESNVNRLKTAAKNKKGE